MDADTRTRSSSSKRKAPLKVGFFTAKPKKDAAVDIPLTEVLWVSEPTMMSGGAIKVMRLDVCVRDRGFARMEASAGSR